MRCGIRSRHNNRSHAHGFAIAPILYLLGLIGVMAGVLFSGYSQILRSGATVQNNIIVKSDLQAAANTLSAEAVFSSNGLTLCPPRSIHQTNGDPCNAAPVALVQFADFTGNQLPANYANAGTTGSPTEVGVFAAGSGIKVLDAYGHTYIYCRWENPRSNPAAPAFVLLSAGADGKLQTRCGDAVAQGDDNYLMMTVGATINRAALWQANGSSNVTYGATGSQVVIDNSGDITAAGNLNVSGNTALAGTLGVTGITTLGALSSSGNITSSANITGNNLTATGSVNGASGSFTSLSGNSLNISGAATIIGTSVLGVLSAGASTLNSLAVTNGASIGSGLSVQGGDIVLANGYGYAQIDSTGVARHLIDLDASNDIVIGSHTNNIYFYAGSAEAGWFDTSGDFTAFGTVNGQNGSFGNLSAGATTLNGTLTGTNANFSGTVVGTSGIFTTLNSTNFTTTNATITGTLTANNFVLSGTATAGTGSFTNLNVTNLAASNAITASGNITAGGTVSGANITATGTVSGATGSFTSLTATSLTVNGNELVKGSLQIQGISSLSSTGIGTGTPQSLLQAYGGEVQVGFSGSACATNNGGAIRFSGNTLYYCDGTNTWRSIYGSGGSGGSGSGSVNAGTQYQMAYYAANGSTLSGDSAIITDSGNDLLVTSGRIGIGSASPVNLLDIGANGGIHIAAGAPTNTSYALYNIGGNLYWNGSAIGSSGGGSGTVTSGSAGQVAYYPNNGATVIGTSTIEIVGGNVGIGVTNPKQALDVYSGGMFVRGPRVIPTSGAGLVLDYGGMGGTGVAGIEAYDYGAGNPLNLTLEPFGGYVGIGTPTPVFPLHVYQNIASTDLILAVENQASGNAADFVSISNGSWARYVSIGTAAEWYIGQNGDTSFSFWDDTNSKEPFVVEVNTPSDTLYLKSTGRVGIGSTVPVNTLDVTGTGIHIASGTPSNTTYQLYNSSGTLYWNGSAIGSGGGGTVSGTANYIPVFTSSTAIGNSVMYQSGSNVGIGVTSPKQALDVYSGGMFVRGPRVTPSSGAGLVMDFGGMGGPDTAGIEAYDYGAGSPLNLVLQPYGGNVGIGNTFPWDMLLIEGADMSQGLSIQNDSSTTAQYPEISLYDYTGGYGGNPALNLATSRGTTDSPLPVQSGDMLGAIYGFGQFDTTTSDLGMGAVIMFLADGNYSSSSFPTDITFNTTPSGSTSLNERMRISASGNVGINTASPHATLDISGYMRLAKNSSQPASCTSSNDGAIALTALYTLCVCKNGTGWVTAATGSTSCTW